IGCDVASPLQRALAGQLAYEATPQAALQLIGFLEQQQTQLDAALKALPPQEKKAVQAAVDALRPRLAALPRSDDPPARPQPVAQANQKQMGTTGPAAFPVAAKVEVEWHGNWYAAEILRVNGASTLIHYTGYDSSWDEWVPPERIRR